MQPEPDLRHESFGALFTRLSDDMMLLVRQELELFRAEMTGKLRDAGVRAAGSAGMFSAAAVCTVFALATLTATVILALSLVMAAWLAALIVTVVYGIAAAIMALRGKRQFDDIKAPIPKQTIETVKEDVAWAKTQTNSARK